MGISFEGVDHHYRGLKKKDITRALNNINLSINEKNEFVAIVGKTGSGKSTLLNHMNALKLPSNGNVKIFEYTITKKIKKNPKLKKIRRRVGYVFQFPEYQLFEENVLKDVMFAPLNFGYSKDEAYKCSIDALERLDIVKLKDRSPFSLSGGQMRRAAIAGVLSYNPDILLLDEPTRGLDPKGINDIMDLFYEIHKETEKSIIMISHDMDIVYKYASRIIVLDNGNIVYDGKCEELFKTDLYLEHHLSKPNVLKLIDYLNSNMNLNLDYNIHDLDSLMDILRGDINE